MEGQIADNPGVTQDTAATPVETTPAPVAAPTIPEGVDPRQHLTNPLMGLINNPAAGTPQPTLQDGAQAAGSEPPAQPGQGSQPVQSTVPTEPRLEIPDKFRNPDGTLNADAAVKSYLELERAYGEQGNKFGQITTEMAQLKELIQQGQAPTPAQPAQPDPKPDLWTPEKEEAWKEEFYEDPRKAITNAIQDTIKGLIPEVMAPLKPIIEGHQHTQQVNTFVGQIQEFAKTNSDIFDYQPEIEQIINKYGENVVSMPNAVEVIYNMAKGMRPAPAAPPPPPTFEQMMADPANRQKILSDPAIKNEFLKGHVTAIKEGAAPPVMGSQPGGMAPAAPSVEIKSTNDAKKASMSFFSKLPFLGQGG